MFGRPLVLLFAGLFTSLPAVAALPVADTGRQEFATRYVAVGESVTLNGSGSYGRSCNLSYAWSLVSKPEGSSASLGNAGSAKPTLVPDKTGDYVISLVVGEAGGTSDPASVTVSAISPSPYPLPAKNADRWMGLTSGLMDRTLAEITFPGTHDSGAYWLDKSRRGPDFNDHGFSAEWWQDVLLWLGGSDEDEIKNQVAYDVARAQDKNLREQLEGGVRYFDLRVTRRNNVFYAYHGLLGEPLETLLNDILTFMAASEGELVAIDVSHLLIGTHEDSSRDFNLEEHQLLMQMLVNRLEPYLYPRNGRSTADLLDMPLSRIVADGSRVILFYEGLPPAAVDSNSEWFWPEGLWTSPGGYTNTEQMFDVEPVDCPRGNNTGRGGQFPDQKCSAKRYSDSSNAKGFVLHQTLTAGEPVATNAAKCRASQLIPDWVPFFDDLRSHCDKTRTLHQLSSIVNPYLPEMLDAILPVRPGLMRVDFFQESAVVSEAIRLNQRDTQAPTSLATRYPPANRYGGSFEDVTVTMTATDEPGGSGVAGIVYSLAGSQSAAPAEYCGAEAKVIVKAKGTTTVSYHAVDRAGNAGPALTLQVRADQQCDFNRDGRLDMADFRGLMFSPRDRNASIVGDLNGDGVTSRQEFEDCFRRIANTR